MNEFIVWDKKTKKFPVVTNIKFDWAGVSARRKPYDDEDVKFISCGMNPIDIEVFQYIGKTDDTPEKNKIYADCSIVEFDWKYTNFEKPSKMIGFFREDDEKLCKYIECVNEYKTKLVYADLRNEITNLKVIGTLQENKELLTEQ